MSLQNNKKREGVEIRKNSTTGILEIRDTSMSSSVNWKPAKFIGHNYNSGDTWHPFGTPRANINIYDSYSLADYSLSLIGNNPNTNYVSTSQNMNGNSFRVYTPNRGSALIDSNDETRIPANAIITSYGDGVLYIPNLYAQNIVTSGIPNVTFANVPVGKIGLYEVVIIDEINNRPSNAGRVFGIRCVKPFEGLTQAEVDAITVTISGNVTSVNGSPATSYVISGANPLKVRRARSVTGMRITNGGMGYASTSKNKGMVKFSFELQSYYYSRFDGGNFDSSNKIDPIIVGRIAQFNNIVPEGTNVHPTFNGDVSNSQYDRYLLQNRDNLSQKRSSIMDLWILDGGENMPGVDYANSNTFYISGISDNWFGQLYQGQGYEFDAGGFDTRNKKTENYIIKDNTYEELEAIFESASKRGVFLSFNLWDGRHPYNSGGFEDSDADRQLLLGYNLTEWKTHCSKMINWCQKLAVKYSTYVKFILGNESTLPYTQEGINYLNDQNPVPNFGENIYWWDYSLDLLANLRKQLDYYNDFIRRIKAAYGADLRLLFGYCGQYGSDSQATQIETLITEDRMNAFDFLANNYYGSFSITEPWKNGSGVDILGRYIAFFNAQTDVKKKLPMLLSECGIPIKAFLVPKSLGVGTGQVPIEYNGTTTPTFTYDGVNVSSQIITVDNASDRATLISNLIAYIKDKPEIMGLQHFGLTLQNQRSQKLQYMQWDSFNCPFPTNAPVGATSATHDVFFDEYYMGDLNYPTINYDPYVGLHEHPFDTAGTTAILTACTTSIRNAIATNYTGADTLIYNRLQTN